MRFSNDLTGEKYFGGLTLALLMSTLYLINSCFLYGHSARVLISYFYLFIILYLSLNNSDNGNSGGNSQKLSVTVAWCCLILPRLG